MDNENLNKSSLRIDHIPDEHLIGIGKVAMAWAYLEGGIERIIWRLLRLDDNDGIAVTTHLNMPMRLDMANSLIDLHLSNSGTKEDFKELSEHIRRDLSPKRNEIVHSRLLYLTEVKRAIRATYKSRGRVSRKTKPIEPEEYDDVIEQIMKAAKQVYNLLGMFDIAKALRNASPNKS